MGLHAVPEGMITMKSWKLVTLCLLGFWPHHAWSGDYTLSVNGEILELDLGSEQKLKLPGGQELTLKLDRKQTSTFRVSGLSFEYPSQFNVATSEISSGIFQHLLATAVGTVVIVQTYPDLNATQLVDFMTSKMTDDDVASGSLRETKPHTRTLADGTVLTGTISTLKRAGDDVIVEVLGARQGRGGIMLMTRTDRITAPDDGAIIERFWATLDLS
jgi:hypothetical protein